MIIRILRVFKKSYSSSFDWLYRSSPVFKAVVKFVKKATKFIKDVAKAAGFWVLLFLVSVILLICFLADCTLISTSKLPWYVFIVNAIVAAAKAVWKAIGQAIFALVKALLDAFWLNRVHFAACVLSLISSHDLSYLFCRPMFLSYFSFIFYSFFKKRKKKKIFSVMEWCNQCRVFSLGQRNR